MVAKRFCCASPLLFPQGKPPPIIEINHGQKRPNIIGKKQAFRQFWNGTSHGVMRDIRVQGLIVVKQAMERGGCLWCGKKWKIGYTSTLIHLKSKIR